MKIREVVILFKKRFNLPIERPAQSIIRSFTLAERAVFYSLTTIFFLSGLFILYRTSESFMETVPIVGGTLREGVVGNPRFINPVLALSEADKNLTSLIYSGLIRVSPTGEVINDLASNIEINETGLQYKVYISENAQFHDGTDVTADDVIFTISKITDPLIKSPRRGNWDGVSVEKIDERTVSFNLKRAYAPFIYNLSIGILPRHIWKNVSADEFSFSQFNTLPVGSGPYKVTSVERNEGGIPDFYRLTTFDNVIGKVPYIENIIFRFFPSEKVLIDAYNGKVIDAMGGLAPEKVADLKIESGTIYSSPLSRIFGVFFNQNQAKIFLDNNVRKALELSAPKNSIVDLVFQGYADKIDGPLPAGIYSWTSPSESNEAEDYERATKLLSDSNWVRNTETGVLEKTNGSAKIQLSFSISTGDAPELQDVATKVKESWEKLGALVTILTFETGELNQNVIRPRSFDSLLFGEMIGRDADLYPFWHSSQRNDPGLNIALYTNSKADKLLDLVRTERDITKTENLHKEFVSEIKKDVPAVFLYTPRYLYILPNKVRNVELGFLSVAQDRFAGVRDWYIEEDRVWRVFLDN